MQAFLEWLPFALIAGFLLLDVAARRVAPPTARDWRLRGLAVTAATVALSYGVGLLWSAYLPSTSLVAGSALGTWLGALVGILVYELVHYVYHRAAHRFDWLWRAGHQMHHSVESIDAFGAYYLHPIDAALFTTWSVLVFYPLLGLTPMAAALATLFLTFNAMFQHMNIPTPRWLGYIIQRPESHSMHHARGVHAYNYSDLPLWDIVFGTFRNPAQVRTELGFYDGASRRIGDMLIGRDVSRLPTNVLATRPLSSAPRPRRRRLRRGRVLLGH